MRRQGAARLVEELAPLLARRYRPPLPEARETILLINQFRCRRHGSACLPRLRDLDFHDALLVGGFHANLATSSVPNIFLGTQRVSNQLAIRQLQRVPLRKETSLRIGHVLHIGVVILLQVRGRPLPIAGFNCEHAASSWQLHRFTQFRFFEIQQVLVLLRILARRLISCAPLLDVDGAEDLVWASFGLRIVKCLVEALITTSAGSQLLMT